MFLVFLFCIVSHTISYIVFSRQKILQLLKALTQTATTITTPYNRTLSWGAPLTTHCASLSSLLPWSLSPKPNKGYRYALGGAFHTGSELPPPPILPITASYSRRIVITPPHNLLIEKWLTASGCQCSGWCC